MTNVNSSISSQLQLLRLPFWTTITILFVGCNRLGAIFFFAKNTELEVRYTLLRVFNNRCVSSVLFQLFFPYHSWSNPWSRPLADCYINSARALFLAVKVTRVFFFLPPYLPLILFHPNFTNCKLHTHTHTHWLTLISGGGGFLRSTRVLHTKLKIPRTRPKPGWPFKI